MAKKKAKRGSTGGKRPIEQYDHKDKTRANNPPVGLVTPQTDPDQPKKTYQYDPAPRSAVGLGGEGRDRRGADRGLPGHGLVALRAG